MKIYLSKKFVFKDLQYRLFAVLVLSISLFFVKYWQASDNLTATSFLVHLQPEPEIVTQKRDLSTYDFGGRIADCFNNFEILPAICEAHKTQARKFILDSWKNKKRAYIILEFNAVDNFSEYYVFIEPDNRQKWQVVWNQEFSDFERGFAKNISSSSATDIQQKIADEDYYPFKREYSILVFLDERGNEIEYY